MRKLDLDYQRSSGPLSWAAWVLLLAGIALSCEVAWSYAKVRKELDSSGNVPAYRGMQSGRDAGKTYSPAEFARARETIEKIAVPWGALFDALASVETGQVALLAIEPDSREGTLSLSGEAHDLPMLLAYVSGLGRTGVFRDVYLKHHESREDDPEHPVAFLIVAHWSRT